jgi:rRNA maturation endonuclease Nob1
VIYVLDTSALIQIKDDLPPRELWEALRLMEELVENGLITFPDQVFNELVIYKVPDSITAWCAGVKHRRVYTGPDYSTVRRVLSHETVGKVCDWRLDTGDPADPWVIALAVELDELGVGVCVVTEDWKDRFDGLGALKKASMQTGSSPERPVNRVVEPHADMRSVLLLRRGA